MWQIYWKVEGFWEKYLSPVYSKDEAEQMLLELKTKFSKEELEIIQPHCVPV